MKNEDNVNRPKHYRKGSVECIDAIKSALGEGYEYYLQGNIIKYVWRYRHKHKSSLEDLLKAEWYLKELIKIKKKWLWKVVPRHGEARLKLYVNFWSYAPTAQRIQIY